MSYINDRIEMKDLIAEAVTDAKTRRNQALDSELLILSLSDEELENIGGGSGHKNFCTRHTMGMTQSDPPDEITQPV